MAALTVARIQQYISNTFSGKARDALYRLFSDLAPTPVDCTAATLTVTQADHANKLIRLNRAAGITVTLHPATGTGAIYRFYVGTTFTGSGIIQVTTTDIIQGAVGMTTDAAGVMIPTAATSDTITMNGSTTGGIVGSYIELQDAALGVWSVRGAIVSTGAEATPFSAAVS